MRSARRRGRRYSLLIYTRMLDRWWPALFLIGLATVSLAWPSYSDLYIRLTEPWRWMTPAAAGGITMLASLVMLLFRRAAHVQPFHDHLRLVTPFLQMRISYRRFLRTTTTVMASMFPPRTLRGLNRDILEPFQRQTAVVIELNRLPISRAILRLYLSPFFFKDETPHLVLLVKDWMGLSTEIDSLRRDPGVVGPSLEGQSSILSGLGDR